MRVVTPLTLCRSFTMDMFITLIIQIISGAVGGNIAGLSKQGL
eukprot:gene981-1297_t